MVFLTELLENEVLGHIGILILVHKDVVEAGRHGIESLRIVPEQDVHIQQDIVEIHHPSLPAFFGITGVDIADFRLLGVRVIDNGLCILLVRLRRYQVVLGHRYAAEHILRLIDFVIKFHFLQARFYGADGITCVIDGE